MVPRKGSVLGLLMLCVAAIVQAANVGDVDIIDAITRDSIVTVMQPQGLAKRLQRVLQPPATTPQPSTTTSPTDSENVDNTTVSGTVKSAGYRIQIFSDNNVRTAKSEARSRSQAVQTRFPQYRAYIVYQSPYWRLKVGDFTTRSEAENAADEIKKVFPSYSHEVRVVKDRINRQ